MDRAEAERECERLTAEHPDRATNRWLPQPGSDGDWVVVRVSLPPGDEERVAELVAEEKPPTADDPRSASQQSLGPHVGPGI